MLDDIDWVISLENESLGTTLGYDMLKSFIDNDFSYAFVYDDVGYISCNFDGYDVEVLNFCVSLKCQNKGIGRKLLNYALSYFYSKGAISAILEVRKSNIRAIHVYEMFGFKMINVRKCYYQNGEDAIVYQKVFIPFKDVFDSYYDLFAKREKLDDAILVYDDKEPLSYYHNYYIIDSKTKIENLKYFNGFINFLSYENLTNKLNGYDVSHNVTMHTNVFALNFFKNNNFIIKKLDDNNLLEAKNFIYNDSKKYGDKFAEDSLRSLIDMDYIYHKINVYLAYFNDEIVGYLHTFKLDNFAKIEDLFVLDLYQHKGIGQALFKYAVNDLKKCGCSDLIIDTDIDDTVIGMYKKMGFNQVNDYFMYLKKV